MNNATDSNIEVSVEEPRPELSQGQPRSGRVGAENESKMRGQVHAARERWKRQSGCAQRASGYWLWMTVKGASRIQVVRARPRRKGEQRRHLKPQPSNTRLR